MPVRRLCLPASLRFSEKWEFREFLPISERQSVPSLCCSDGMDRGFVTKKQETIRSIDGKSWLFLILSGIATGASWLCYYRALQTGPASVVVPIDKLSILITIGFSYIVFGEKLSKKAAAGLVLIVAGTWSLLFV